MKAYDKAKVEAGVLLAYREIAAPLRNRTFSSLAELNAAIEAFADLYNEQWLPGKNGFLSPSATRKAWYAGQAQGVAA